MRTNTKNSNIKPSNTKNSNSNKFKKEKHDVNDPNYNPNQSCTTIKKDGQQVHHPRDQVTSFDAQELKVQHPNPNLNPQSQTPKMERSNSFYKWFTKNQSRAQCLRQITPNCQWFRALDKKRKITTIAFALFISFGIIITSIVLPIMLTIPPAPQGIRIAAIEYKQNNLFVNSAQYRNKHHYSQIFISHKNKIQSIHPSLQSVTKMLTTSDGDSQIRFNIPIMSVLQTFNNQQKQKLSYERWLQDYNANPRQTTDKLIETIRTKLSKTGTYKFEQKIPDNLTLTSVSEKLQIDVMFNPYTNKFVLFNFNQDPFKMQFDTINQNDKNLKSQINKNNKQTPSQQLTKSNSNTQGKNDLKLQQQNTNKKQGPKEGDDKKQIQQLMAKVMVSTVYYIKRVVARNVQAIRAKSQQLLTYQKLLISQSQIDTQWQKAIVDECRTLQPLRFRCSFEGAKKLVQDFDEQKIKAGSDYVLTPTLSLRFKQLKQVKE